MNWSTERTGTKNESDAERQVGRTRQVNRTRQEGFTLVEAIVAVMIVVLVAGIVLTTYLLAVQQVSRWRDGLALESQTHIAAQRVVSDLRRAARVAWEEDEGLLIIASDSSRVTYALGDSALTRQGRPMHGPEIRVTEWSAVVEDGQSLREEGVGASLGETLLGETLEPTDPSPERAGPVYVEVMLAFADRHQAIRVVTGSTVRVPRAWP